MLTVQLSDLGRTFLCSSLKGVQLVVFPVDLTCERPMHNKETHVMWNASTV